MDKPLKIPINKPEGIKLIIYPLSSNAKVFEVEQADDLGEARWQLVEGEDYEYEFQGEHGPAVGYYFKEHELVRPSKSTPSRGLIKTGIYVGCLSLPVANQSGFETEVSFEVRSVKVDYREDYRSMLHDITRHFTDLVMMQGAPVTQQFEVDVNEDGKTLYQQFAFMKSLVDSPVGASHFQSNWKGAWVSMWNMPCISFSRSRPSSGTAATPSRLKLFSRSISMRSRRGLAAL